jgi:Phasin protein
MRQTKRASKKRSKLAKQAQDTATRIERRYQDAAPTGLTAKSSHSVGDFNDRFRQIADEMNTYSVRSMEQVLHAWEQFLDAGPLRQVFEFQTRYAQNAQNAYESYVDEISRLGQMYLDVTRRVSKPLAQVPRRAK